MNFAMADSRNSQNLIQISKFLSYLLRHAAQKHKLAISTDGFVSVDAIIKLPQSKSYKLTLEMVKTIVETNDKKRFELKEIRGQWLIRAVQGHSIRSLDEKDMMEEIVDPASVNCVIHGTFNKFWPSIRNEGLKTMSRNHIHFAKGFPQDKSVISGMRKTCEVFIEIDLKTALEDGIKFFKSSNDVILTSGIDGILQPKYFKKVTDRNGIEIK
jgi:2'-phosphotransferase